MPRSWRQSHPRPRRRTGHLGCRVLAGDRQLQTWLSKEQEDEIQQAPRGPGSSMSVAPGGCDKPGMDPSGRLPATLVTRCPLRLLPSGKALSGASRSGRT
jgi:hypothetical protein